MTTDSKDPISKTISPEFSSIYGIYLTGGTTY